MSEPSSQAGAGDPRPSQQPSHPATPGVRVNSPHVIPQGPAPEGSPTGTVPPARPAAPPASEPPAHRPSAAPTAATAGAGRSAPPSDDLFAPAPAGRNEEGSPNRTRNLLACGGCLLLALILALGAFLGFRWLSPDDGGYEHPETPTAQQSETPGESEQPPSEEPVEEVSPAPEGAIEMSALVSPSGNIHCTLEGDDVACSLTEHFLENNTGGKCTEDAPFAVRIGAEGEHQLDCGTSVAQDSAQELAYDQSAKNGSVACTSESTGMTCWNTRTGKGFTIARDTYETF